MKRNRASVRLLRVAEEDLTEILAYHSAENPRFAEKLLDRIEKGLGSLGTYPYLGLVPSDSELVKLKYRYLVIEDYLVFYTIAGATVLVHLILHGARDYKGLL